ncbi:MAG: hypothetical protein IJE23_04620 [Tyzzerella sp.]|nr:hypothetical protein [Tyzzerella sp.]
MKIKKTFAVVMVLAVVATSFVGCGAKRVNHTLPAFDDEATIIRSAWWCPEPTAENYDVYKECGLNTLLLVNHNFRTGDFATSDHQLQLTKEYGYYIGTPEDFDGETMTDQSLALAKEKGLDVILAEGEAYFAWIGEPVNVYEDFTIDYSEYEDIIVGVFSGDEPSAPEMKEQAKNIKNVEKVFPNVPYFANLFPCYADLDSALKANSYNQYLDEYGKVFLSKTSKPRMISVDFYPFIGTNNDKMFYNYELFTDKAMEYDADMHMFIQSCVSADGSHRMLNEQEIMVQVSTALAYGARAYSYFLYAPAGTGYPEGLVDGEGKPAAMYYHAQKANALVTSMEKAYMHYDYVNTIAVTDDERDYAEGAFGFLPIMKNVGTCEESEILENVSATNRALVSIMRDKDGNEAFYIMNYFDNGDSEMEEDCTVTLNLKNMKKVALYGTTECLEGEVQDVKKNEFTYTLTPGEGMLVIPYRK